MIHPGHQALKELRLGRVIDLDGVLLKMDEDGEVRPGDNYVGARNTADIYVCRKVEDGLLWPEGIGYPFNIREGVRVQFVEEAGVEADYVVPAGVLK